MSVLDRLNSRVVRLQDSARGTRAAIDNAKPPVRIAHAAAVPSWALRILILLLGSATIVLLDPGIVAIVVLAALVLLAGIHPTATTGAAYCAALGLIWLITPGEPWSVPSFVVVALAPLLWTIAGVCTGLPWRAVIEWRVFRTPAVRYLLIQLLTQVLLVGATGLQSAGSRLHNPVGGLIAFICVILIAVGAWLILPRIARHGRD